MLFRTKSGYKTASVMSAVDQDSSTHASLVTASIVEGDPLHYFDVFFQSKHSLGASGMYLNLGFEVRNFMLFKVRLFERNIRIKLILGCKRY